jgi:hypothetical protein
VNQTIATMAGIAAGSYVFSAKTTIVSDTGTNDEAAITCTLDAGGTTDTSENRVVRLTTPARAVVQMQLVKTFAGTGSALVRCSSDASFTISARHTTIIAIKVDAVTRTAVNG